MLGYSLNLTNFWVAKYVETSDHEHSMVAQKSRNDSQECYKHLDSGDVRMYQSFNKCTAIQQ